MNKNIFFSLIFTILGILFFTSCKKSNSTIVGNWKFINFTASNQNYSTPNDDSISDTYFYNYQTQSVFQIRYSSTNLPHQDTQIISLKFSNWSILNNGTYSIDEDAYNDPVTKSGTWEYLSNNTLDNAVTFRGGGSIFFQQFFPTNTFIIQSVTDNKLILTYSSSSTSDSTGAYNNNSVTITFTK
jgi:hypothetical protein